MSARFVVVDRNTPLLMPPDLREWVPENDLVHFVIGAIERLPLSAFQHNERGTGSSQYPPHMMLALLVYCYANGIFSSRRIERATHRDIAVRYLAGDTHPDHETICKFRRENFAAISDSFVSILELAKELKLLQIGSVAIDGTHIKADASIDQNVTYQRSEEIREQLRNDVDELLAQAEQADNDTGKHDELPEELARRESLDQKLEQAQKELQRRAKQKQQQEQNRYETQMEERQLKENKNGKKLPGKPPKEPDIKAGESDEQCNLTDPDSRTMRKNKRSGYTQSYNSQAAVDADGSQLILGQHVSQSASDANELEQAIQSIPSSLGEVPRVLADAGYLNADTFEKLEEAGIDLYCSAHREDAHNERKYDYRPLNQSQRPVKKLKDERIIKMRDKLQTDEGKREYAKRGKSVETTFGIIKEAIGFRSFRLRGLEKVSGEWNLVCLSYNMKRLFNLITAQKT